jgi:hypothetical protein
VRCFRLGASGAEKFCALGAMIRRFCAPPRNFTVRVHESIHAAFTVAGIDRRSGR